MQERTIVLLGAGSSADAGLPLTSELASQIVMMANEKFGSPFQGRDTPSWVKALNAAYGGMVSHQSNRGHSPLTAVNIETLISAIRLLQNPDEHEVAPFVANWSPVLSSFSDPILDQRAGRKIAESVSKLIVGRAPFAERDISEAVAQIARTSNALNSKPLFIEAEDFILRTLTQLLSATEDVGYLKPIVDLSKSQSGGVDVVTLNYDLTVERIAAAAGVTLNRGIETWHPGGELSFPPQDGVINLLKLHGSLDWRAADRPSFRPDPLSLPQIQVADVEEMSGREVGRRRSWIIVGDRGKLETEGPTLALNFAARKVLDRATHLAVIGYSFGDSHVNSLIRDWLAFNDTRTISILDRSWQPAYWDGGRDFRSALVERYSRDGDRDGNPALPRLVAVKGTAASHLGEVLAARPEIPRQPSLELRNSDDPEGRVIVATWRGTDLYNAQIEATSHDNTESTLGTPVQLLLRSEEDMPATGLIDLPSRGLGYVKPIQLEKLADGESLELLLPEGTSGMIHVRINGSTLTGIRKSASCQPHRPVEGSFPGPKSAE